MSGDFLHTKRPMDLAETLAAVRSYQPGKDVPWPITRAQYWQFCELLEQLNQHKEGTDTYAAIVDEMKSIPGYPKDVDQEHDTIHFVITTGDSTW